MKFKIKTYLIVALLGFIFAYSSCVKEDYDNPPSNCDDINFTATHTIQELKAMFDGDTTLITDSIIIQGTVTSTDLYGNFYKEVVIEDETGAICINANVYDIFLTYPIGQKVFVSCKNLYLDEDYDVVKLGDMYLNGGSLTFGGMEEETFLAHLIKTCDNSLFNPTVKKFSEVTNDDFYKIVKFENVQFVDGDLGKVWSENGSNYTVRNLIDDQGHQFQVSTSEYSTFALDTIPGGSGTIIGLVGYFSGAYQLIVRNSEDAEMSGGRF
ncbi:MAG: hypothetical protein JXL97_17245 [Bacteroidales bacterium]|nr:hypothetical protein [Bacteroidales bacterium]